MKGILSKLAALLLGAGLIQAEGDGRFQLGKVNGRDCLIDPSGKPFLSLGVNHIQNVFQGEGALPGDCLLYTSPSPRDCRLSRMPSSA